MIMIESWVWMSMARIRLNKKNEVIWLHRQSKIVISIAIFLSEKLFIGFIVYTAEIQVFRTFKDSVTSKIYNFPLTLKQNFKNVLWALVWISNNSSKNTIIKNINMPTFTHCDCD